MSGFDQKLMTSEALAQLEALCATAVMRSPGDFKIGEYQAQPVEDEEQPKYNLFLTARLASKKDKTDKKGRIITL